MVHVKEVNLHPNFAARHSNLNGGLIATIVLTSRTSSELQELKDKIEGSYSNVEKTAFEMPFITSVEDGYGFELQYEVVADDLNSYYEPRTLAFYLVDKANDLKFEW